MEKISTCLRTNQVFYTFIKNNQEIGVAND